MLRTRYNTGFTLIEVVVVIFIFVVLAGISVAAFSEFQKKTELNNAAEEFMGVLKLAQSKAVSSENTSQYGVYIDISTTPDRYVLFKGTSYATRDTAFDQIYLVPKTVEFTAISLGGGSEVVFERVTAFSQQSGSLALRLIQDTSQVKTVYIATSGALGLALPQNPSDAARIKDSRHVHFSYARTINTATENVVLTFNGTTVKTLPVASNLVAGQFYWKGTVAAGGSNQTVVVQTHRLNNADTQFSVHRDKSLNDKTFNITLSGDSSGDLVNYSADGATVTYSSIYVSNLIWQ